MADPVDRIVAAAIEGQARSPRFIQHQLSRLHAALVNASADLRAVIRKESKHSTAEVEIQYALTLENITNCFSSIKFDAAMEQEYKLARSENSTENLAPYGIAYIQPARYNIVYSTITAIAAAILAGNCVILEMPESPSETTNLLIKTLQAALNRDSFHTSRRRIDCAPFPVRPILLYGSSAPKIPVSENVLVAPTARSIAIVDRYADLQQATTAILRARFSFGGESPVAPDLILVNEYRSKEFCTLIADKLSHYFAAQLTDNGGLDTAAGPGTGNTPVSMKELDQGGAEIIMNLGSKGCIAQVTDRKSNLLRRQVNEPLLIVHSVTSLDDAIDLANNISGSKPFAALHVFGSPEAGKYASQFLSSHLSCINDIPIEFIVSPLTPVRFATQLGSPYRKEMFSIPSPQYIDFSDKATKLATLVDKNSQVEAQRLREQAESIKVKVKQAPGHAIGFFEQGIVIGTTLALTSLALGSILSWKYGIAAISSLVR